MEKSVARYLAQLDTADLQEPSQELAMKTAHLREKLIKLESEMQRLATMEKLMLASPDQQISLTDPDSRSMATSGRGSGVVGYNVQVALAGRRKFSASTNSKPLPIGATTAVRKSSRVTRPPLR